MATRREFLKYGSLALAGVTLGKTPASGFAFSDTKSFNSIALSGLQNPTSTIKHPEFTTRKFISQAVDDKIKEIATKLNDKKLRLMFTNCYPNTLDTTINYQQINGQPDTFVITGDIDAMWLRDSTAQVWPYLPLATQDKHLQEMLMGVIHRQTKCILIDPYANAFAHNNDKSRWMSDQTDMKPSLHERKWEIDSLCYPIRLAYHYWKITSDISIFTADWQRAAVSIVDTFITQQRKQGRGPYSFLRVTNRPLDTLQNDGWGSPIKPCGLIVSSFRPSDDATTFQFLIPSNLFAVVSLQQLAEISQQVTRDIGFAKRCIDLANEVQQAITKYGIIHHPKYGKIYAFEVDGFGNALLTDDANVPSLLSLPYLGLVASNDAIYQNTRRFVWSNDNPYFFKGKAAEGIGGPHCGLDMIWPMSIIMKAITSDNNEEMEICIRQLLSTDADTGFMHESFHKDDPKNYTRSWFAWANTLFGELIIKLVEEKRPFIFKANLSPEPIA